VAISAFWGLAGARTSWEGIPVYPCGAHPFGSDVAGGHVRHFGADLLLVLADPFAQDADMLAGQNVVMWCPVDREPLGGADTEAICASGAQVIAMSRFGESMLAQAGLGPMYAPHGIDTQLYRPMRRKEEIRKALGVPQGHFVVGINGTNKDPVRKGFAEQFAAFAGLHAMHPDTMLLVHAMPSRSSITSIDLYALAANLGISDAVGWADAYAYQSGSYTMTDMAAWYNALDLLSNCSYGEGFGLPIIEAQACGVPVVVTDSSSMSELRGPGWKVPAEPYWVDAFQAWWSKPVIGDIAGSYMQAYVLAREGALAIPAAKSREFALGYDADAVFAKYWLPVLAQLEETTADIAKGIRRFGGFRWRIDGDSLFGDRLALGHEGLLDQKVLSLLPDGGVFLDVGAHVGHYTVRASAKASKVIAVEANPETVERLQENLSLNGVTNTQVHSFAAWDEHAFLELSSPHGVQRDGSTRTLPSEDGQIPAMPLDDVLCTEPRIDLVKLDVEGADLHALRGLHETILRCRPVLFIEDHSVYGYYERADLDKLLAALGYTARDLPLYRGYVVARPEGSPEATEITRGAMLRGASQRPDELAGLLETLGREDLKITAEIGCDAGGTLFAWKQVCPEVYGITLADNSYQTGGTDNRPLHNHGAAVHLGDSHDAASWRWLEAKLHGRLLDLLVIDGDHRAAGVRADLEMYGPLVRPGGLIALHDIAATDDERAEVHRVWPDLVRRYDTSEILSKAWDPYGWGVIRVRDGDTFGPEDEEGDTEELDRASTE
jgi:FkbM family methyltransferase